MAQFERYGIGPEEAAEGALWIGKLLNTENAAERADWMIDVLEEWDAAGHPPEHLVLIEDAILEQAARRRANPTAATTVRTRKLRRHGRTVTRLADKLTDPKDEPVGGPA
jgi:hypothetical protein